MIQSITQPVPIQISTINEVTAQQAATAYLVNVVGKEYHASNGFYGNGRWYFLIDVHCESQSTEQNKDQEPMPALGKIAVNAFNGNVLALTEAQIQQVRETRALQIAQTRGETARNEQGYVLRYPAQVKASTWLSNHLTFHCSAIDGIFIPLEQPRWQFSIRFRLPSTGEIKPLGVIDVDAITGKVMPLSPKQTQTIQERLHAIVEHSELAAAA